MKNLIDRIDFGTPSLHVIGVPSGTSIESVLKLVAEATLKNGAVVVGGAISRSLRDSIVQVSPNGHAFYSTTSPFGFENWLDRINPNADDKTLLEESRVLLVNYERVVQWFGDKEGLIDLPYPHAISRSRDSETNLVSSEDTTRANNNRREKMRKFAKLAFSKKICVIIVTRSLDPNETSVDTLIGNDGEGAWEAHYTIYSTHQDTPDSSIQLNVLKENKWR